MNQERDTYEIILAQVFRHGKRQSFEIDGWLFKTFKVIYHSY